MNIIQGSTYLLSVYITNDDGSNISIENVEAVEFSFGIIKKKYPDQAEFDTDHFIVSLSQEDTFKLKQSVMCQFRVKYKDGQVKSSIPQVENVIESISKEIL